jgi:CBS-domain-containing membrane protein
VTAPSERRAFNQQDLHQALADFGEVLDVSEDDLAAIFTAAEQQAQKRRFGAIRCGDIMSRDVVSIQPEASLQQAWDKLAHHKVKALPVIDAAGRLQGWFPCTTSSCRTTRPRSTACSQAGWSGGRHHEPARPQPAGHPAHQRAGAGLFRWRHASHAGD